MLDRLAHLLFDEPEAHPGWPEATPVATLPSGASVQLRPATKQDGRLWSAFRREDEASLRVVEPTALDWNEANSVRAWGANFRFLTQEAYSGRVLPFAITLNKSFVGQLTLGNIQRGAVSEAWIGYWVSSRYQGLGIATAAVALGVDHAFAGMKLHRLTATFLPDNAPSRAVLSRIGFREEGFLRRALHIDGEWRDHVMVALNEDDYPTLAINRLWRMGRVV